MVRFEIQFPRPAMVMGIVNVTPDSFSDGGQFLDPEAAVERALELIEQLLKRGAVGTNSAPDADTSPEATSPPNPPLQQTGPA